MLLHIADTILDAGPMWVSWVFVMERLCGRLQRAVSSRRHPYSSMNAWALEYEQIKILKNQFDIHERLQAECSKQHTPSSYSDCMWLFNWFFIYLIIPRSIRTFATPTGTTESQ